MKKTKNAIVKSSVLFTNHLKTLADLENLLPDNGINITPIVEVLNHSFAVLGHRQRSLKTRAKKYAKIT